MAETVVASGAKAGVRPVTTVELFGRYRCVKPGGVEDLVVRADGTYELGGSVGGAYGVESGTWTYNGNRIDLATRMPGGGSRGLSMSGRRRIGGSVIFEFSPDEGTYFRKTGSSMRPIAG